VSGEESTRNRRRDDGAAATPSFQGGPQRRVILLGASNLARGISTVVETAWNAWGKPLDVVAALGHGRSYGAYSLFAGHWRPGILESALWRELAARPALPTAGLLTDVGNDILYEEPLDRIATWLEEAMSRLARHCEKIVVTELPLENAHGVSERRFRMVRNLFFPFCRLELGQVMERARVVNDALVGIARRHGAVLCRPSTDWFGLDPIHLKLRHWSRAWAEILSAWTEGRSVKWARGSFWRWFYLRRLKAHHYRFLRREVRQKQPAGRLRDGTRISLY